jgi:hypothetical protein
VAAGGVLQCQNVGGSGSIDTHGSCYLVTTSDTGELISGPHTEDGTDCEVGVDNAGPIERIECNAESTCTRRNTGQLQLISIQQKYTDARLLLRSILRLHNSPSVGPPISIGTGSSSEHAYLHT